MKKLVLLLASMLIAGQAGAKTLDWNGTLDVELWGGGATSLTFQGSGVATVNDSSGSAHLSTLRLAGGISGSGTIPITDPETTGTVKTVHQDSVGLGTGTISGISGAPPVGPGAAIPIPGHSRVCIFQANCGLNLPLELTANNGNTGVGVGGTVTLGGNGTIRISIEGAPWTLGTVSRTHQTIGGNFEMRTRAGFVHGAASGSDSSTAAVSGVIQLITPQQVKTAGLPGNSTRQALFSTLTLHFIPEPGLLLLLASGVLGLGLLGRGRMKRE
jgi:hypothetical protein